MPIIRILHLSDLRNCGSSAPPVAVTGTAWDELLDEIADVGLIDLVALTGDLSERGTRAEFSGLTAFLGRSCTRLGVPMARVFAVPGDRDVDHSVATAQGTKLRALAWRDPAGVSAWIAGRGPPPTGADQAWCRAVFERQQAFWDWLSEDLRQPGRRAVDALGYRETLTMAGSQAPVELFGLNSAWLSGSRSSDDAMLLGSEQVASLVRDPKGAPHSGLRVALVHHPPVSLADADACGSVLAGAVDLILCGHGSHPRLDQVPGDDARVLASGPLGDDPVLAPSCQLVQIETDSGGRPIGFAVRIWTWCASQSCWLSAAPNIPGARRGRFYWLPGDTTPSHRALVNRGSRLTLERVLASMFASADELRKWLYMRVPEIYIDLPGGTASIRDLAFAAQGLLERKGLIDDELLDALADFSPAHGRMIVELGDRIAQPALTNAVTPAGTPTVAILPLASPQADPLLQRRLELAKRRRDNLRGAGHDSTAIEAEILELRRQLRQGSAWRQGELLADRYLLKAELGRGGFATVWRAHDTIQGGDVALKILHPQDAQDPTRRERFLRGARAMQQLQHPATVRVLTPWDGTQQQPFYVMELIDGPNLHEVVIGRPRLHLREIVKITSQIGEALAEAHGLGMVHRDVKPANILLNRERSAHLTDFDLVRARDTTGGTRTGGIGTILYAAPELVQNADDADARADIYGLGMTVLFMLFGKDLPYKDIIRNPQALLARVACPAATKQVVLQAIDWDRERRFADVTSFCAALRETSRPASSPTHAPMPVKVVPSTIHPRDTTIPSARELGLFAFVAVALVSMVVALGSWRTPQPEIAGSEGVSSLDSASAPPSPATMSAPTPNVLPPSPPPVLDDTSSTGVSTDPASPEMAAPVLNGPPAPTASEPTIAPRKRTSKQVLAADAVSSNPAGSTAPDTSTADVALSADLARPKIDDAILAFGNGKRAICWKDAYREDYEDGVDHGETIKLKIIVGSNGKVMEVSSDFSARNTGLADCLEKKFRHQTFISFDGAPQIFEPEIRF